MNSTQIKCLCVFSVFAIIGFGPISPGCLIGMYIVITRPNWFLKLTDNLYDNPVTPQATSINTPSKNLRIKCFLCLLTLFIIVIAFIIILSRPRWFYRVIRGVYADIG